MRGSVLIVLFSGYLNMILCQYSYQQMALNMHNHYRSQHGAPRLTFDNQLTNAAMKCAYYYAERRALDHSCPHRNDKGENLWGRKGVYSETQITETVMNTWYSERNLYNYNQPPPELSPTGLATGHFTQMIWKSSTSFGFGVATVNGYSVAVALYGPLGNIKGQFPQNVS